MNYLLDNGAFTIKFAARDTQPKILQNCIGRNKNDIVVSPKSLFELSEVLRPHERGVMVDPDLQVKIWKSLLPDQISSLVYTCPLYTPVSCRKLLDEIVYEDFNIAAALRVPFGPRENCFLVDLGFSASVVTPIFKGFPVSYAVKKVEIGGKLLTNYLKEQISYRYFDMTEETWLVNHIREEMCYISQSFLCELRGFQKKSQSGQNYVLPEANDYGHALLATENFTGKQVLNLSNLAICVPELLFRPSDIGVKCAGIAEAVVQSSELLTQAMREELLLNIVVVGGIAKTKGLCERLQQEIQENVSSPVKIFISENPELENWNSLKNAGEMISKNDYEEMGTDYIDSKAHYL